MIATYVVGGVGLALAFNAMAAGDTSTGAAWASAVAVGGSGLLSFVRHSIFHRSDAARMRWDYGSRNDFQIEVGLANLAWGVVGIAAWALDWGVEAQGAVILVFGLYLLFAGILHLSEAFAPQAAGGHRYASTVATFAFASALVVCGGLALGC